MLSLGPVCAVCLCLQDLGGRRAAQFLSKVQHVAGRLPYMVAPGNHEFHGNFSHYRWV